MKRRVLNVAMVLALVLSGAMFIQGCSSKVESSGADSAGSSSNSAAVGKVATDSAEGKAGFEPGNILNQGIAAGSGEWVYYSDIATENQLFRMKADGSEKSRVSEDSVKYINVLGNIIYYVNLTDGEKIYSIKYDGSEKTKITDNASEEMYVYGDRIIYVNKSDCENIYSMAVNGSDKKLLVDFKYEPEGNIMVALDGGWIYYTSKPDGALHKMKLDGSEKFDFSQKGIMNLNVLNGKIVYTHLIPNESADFSIYTMNTDGSGEAMLKKGKLTYNPWYIIARDKYVYIVDQWGYDDLRTDDDYDICRVPIDGSSDGERLTKTGALYFSITGDWIYYSGFNDNKMHRVKLNGSGEKVLSE